MKRLYKDRKNGKIGGVCAGISDYLNIDVTIIRIIWGVAAFFYAIGLILYLVCWFVLPDKSESDLF